MLLDIDLDSGDYFLDTRDYLIAMVIHVLQTPFESRIFNPGAGSNITSLLQEPTGEVSYNTKVTALITSAIERAMPDSTVTTKVKIESNGNGTASVRISLTIEYKGTNYAISLNTLDFIN